MGQKTHPLGLRLGIIKGWRSRWFAAKNFPELLQEDILIRRYVNKRLEHAGVADIEILRAPKKVTIDIHTAKPGIVIGRKGAEVDKLKEELQMLTSKEILLNIIEVKKPETDASLVAQQIARQLEGRVSFRRAMKKSVATTMKSGAEGIKIICSGRLGGAEIARSEKYHQGRVPLHTLRADIDYSQATANTTYGTIGVKVWICRGEILDKEKAHAKLLGESGDEKKPAASGEQQQKGERRERRGSGDSQGDRQKRREGGRGGQRRQQGGARKPSAKALDRSQHSADGGGAPSARPDNRPTRKEGGQRDNRQPHAKPEADKSNHKEENK
ncbi:MAG: 30S ribosomal protein S3 [candidate division Zixibacteria bacterium]|nr:30S ribosomal protein S3 [candidate division Zixibacteria bacterium]